MAGFVFFAFLTPSIIFLVHAQVSTIVTDSQWIDIGTNSVYYIEKLRPVDYFRAAWTCNLMGLNRTGEPGNLVSFVTASEEVLLRPYFKDLPGNVWIGLLKGLSGSFTWVDGRELTYTNWEPGEPNNENNEDCVEIRQNSKAWNDVPCNIEKLYICASKKENGKAVVFTNKLDTAESKEDCGPGLKNWKFYRNNCYLVKAAYEDALDWMSAEQYCVEQNAHLVSVIDQREEDFILKGLLHEIESMHTLWAGLKCTGNVPASTWTDGNPTIYTKFDTKEVSEGCVAFNLLLGQWKSMECSRKMGLICKMPYSDRDIRDCSEKLEATALRDAIENFSSRSQEAGITVNIVISLLILLILIYLLIKRWAVQNTISSWIQDKIKWRRKSIEDTNTIQNSIESQQNV